MHTQASNPGADLISCRDVLEALLRVRLFVHIRVELAGQLAVRALDRLLVCSARKKEHPREGEAAAKSMNLLMWKSKE